MGKLYSPREIKYGICVIYSLAVLVTLILQNADHIGMINCLFFLTIADIDFLFIEY